MGKTERERQCYISLIEIKEACTALPLLIVHCLNPHLPPLWNEHRQCTNHPGLLYLCVARNQILTIRSKGMFTMKRKNVHCYIVSLDTTHCLITPPPSTLKTTTANVPPVPPLGRPFLCVSNQKEKERKIEGMRNVQEKKLNNAVNGLKLTYSS